jgi:tetratricopeptide (TPR) repeat protein
MSGYISDQELVHRNARFVGVLGTLHRLATYRLMEQAILAVKTRLGQEHPEEREVVVRVLPEDYGRNVEQMIAFAREHRIGIAMINVPVPLEWPAGLQFKLFSDMRTLQGELLMSDQTQKLLQRKIAYALDWEQFSRNYHQITDYSIGVFRSAYEDLGDIDSNKAFYEQRLLAEPDNCVFLNNLGVLFCKEGNYPAAREYFRMAMAEDPSYPVFHYNLGMALKGEGKLDEAEAELEKAKDLDYQSLRIKSAYKEKLKQLSVKYDVPLVDAVSAFNREGRESLFLDHCHPTREGHGIIAEEIAKVLEAQRAHWTTCSRAGGKAE